ncbi:MAG TPA: hypothetical protein DGX96_11730 [Lachnospiraceae bacterium]|nr:hypothetical protein [Lachnospiraceae bacterium]
MRRNWKRIFALVLVLGMMFALAACGEKSTVPEEVGTYEFKDMTYEGEVYTMEDLGLDTPYTMVLREDGTGYIDMDGESAVTWGDGKLTDETGDVYDYVYKDDVFTMTQGEEMGMTFQKTTGEDSSK